MTITLNISDNMMKTIMQMTGYNNIIDIEKTLSNTLQNMIWEDIQKRYNKNVSHEEFRNVLKEISGLNEPIDEDRI